MTNTITYAQALEMAIKVCSAPANAEEYSDAVVEKLTALKEKYSTPRKSSDATKAKQAAKRAEARNEVVTEVAPIVFRAVTTEPSTAKEIFERCEGLPEGFTAPKVQYLLLHELAAKVIKTEAKGKPNTYHRI